jgi:LysM repeat protein
VICLALAAVLIVPALPVPARQDSGHDSSPAPIAAAPATAALSPYRAESLHNLELPQAEATLPPTAQPTPSPLPTPAPEPLPTMEVRPGETLIELASWFGVTPFDIAAANGVGVDDFLHIGQVLSIPVPEAAFALPPAPANELALADPVPDVVPVAQPTPAPVTAAPPPATPSLPPASSDVVAAICSLPWPCDQMVRIAACESGLNPASVNPAGYWGLFQLSYQFPGWDDPLTNATVAYQQKYLPALAAGDGLSPWPVCRSY